MRIGVVGQGLVGQACVRMLAGQGHAIAPIAARALLAGDAPPPAELVVFAHGKPVTVKRFAEAYDDLLASRAGPLQAFRAGAPAVLISSTVACLSSPADGRDLPNLQRAFEAAFLARFPDGSVLRLGAMRGPGWQIDEGLAPLKRTLLLKRLRMTGHTDIPWADDTLLAEALRQAVSKGRLKGLVAYPKGFDVNAFLDAGLGPTGFRVRIPDAWFRGAYESLGAPPSFLSITTADLAACGWEPISPPPALADQVGMDTVPHGALREHPVSGAHGLADRQIGAGGHQ